MRAAICVVATVLSTFTQPMKSSSLCCSSGRTTPGGATPLYVLGSLDNEM